MTPISDASYNGLGGWALEHPCIWRLSKADMESCGFVLPKGKEPTTAEKDDKLFDHINILEFVTVFVNAGLPSAISCCNQCAMRRLFSMSYPTTPLRCHRCSTPLVPSIWPSATLLGSFKPC